MQMGQNIMRLLFWPILCENVTLVCVSSVAGSQDGGWQAVRVSGDV